MARCVRCGGRSRKEAVRGLCGACYAREEEVRRGEARIIVDRGTCPTCGAGLYRNSALAGWWQCGRYPSESFRRPEYRGQPTCGYQIFTE